MTDTATPTGDGGYVMGDGYEVATVEPVEAEQENTPPEAVPKRVRTWVYIAALAVNVAALLGFGLADIWGWLESERAIKSQNLVLMVVGLAASGLGVAYRPTRR